MAKYRQQMKRLNLNIDKCYRMYDEQDVRYVFKNDFVDISLAIGFDFSFEELINIFNIICEQGSKAKQTSDQQEQVNQKAIQDNKTRFNLTQFTNALQDNRDENWMFQAYIKIHSTVLQKSLTYKRLFNTWKDKKSKSGSLRLNQVELTNGLKRLKAGLTMDEVSRLCQA